MDACWKFSALCTLSTCPVPHKMMLMLCFFFTIFFRPHHAVNIEKWSTNVWVSARSILTKVWRESSRDVRFLNISILPLCCLCGLLARKKSEQSEGKQMQQNGCSPLMAFYTPARLVQYEATSRNRCKKLTEIPLRVTLQCNALTDMTARHNVATTWGQTRFYSNEPCWVWHLAALKIILVKFKFCSGPTGQGDSKMVTLRSDSIDAVTHRG